MCVDRLKRRKTSTSSMDQSLVPTKTLDFGTPSEAQSDQLCVPAQRMVQLLHKLFSYVVSNFETGIMFA